MRIWMLAVATALRLAAQNDWPVYGHDAGGAKFSPLKQIDRANVAKLAPSWSYHTGETGRQFESTPLVAGGVMYVSTQQQRVVALEPETGKEIWKYDSKSRAREHRGVSYWPGDAQTGPRIVFGTGDGKLIALDAKTGKPAAGFGDNGVVDLRIGVADKFPKASYAITSPPAIYRNLAIVGPNTQEGPSLGPSGDPRAFDVRTGKLVWRFHTVPQPGEAGNETWGPDGWKDRSGPSLWGVMTVDTERGLVFLPTGNPADSFYGGDRKGTNLYSNSVVALDAGTGKLRWYYQMVHHDIFDYDVTGAPSLIDVVQRGKKIPAVAEVTKTGLLFILNRLDGKPIFGAEERPVPKSDVPGEQAWPTQPFPLKPPPLARMSLKREELSKRTPESEKFCRALFDGMREEGPYTPFGIAKPTLLFPGAMGGGNWGGVSFDPGLGYVFVNTSDLGAMGHMVPAPGAPVPYRNESGYARFVDQDQYPCQQPPWGQLSAVNANTGDIAWRVPLGSFEELEAQGFKNAGTPNVGGTIATAGGLVFVAATNDAKMRAFDSATGKVLWTGALEATGNSTPITYLGRDGRQYVAITAGGPNHLRSVGNNATNIGDSLMAFALPDGKSARPEPISKVVTARAQRPAVNGQLPDAAGRDVVVRVCAKCHGVGTFANTRMTRNQWRDEVDDMVARGAVGTPDELRTVLEYLARNLAAGR